MIETIIKSIISYVVPAILGFLVAKLINYKKKTDGLKNGVMIMLQSNLTNTFFYYESLKAMPDYVYKNFLNELKAYEDLGGDDYIHTIVDNMINFSNTPEKEAIQQLRDKMATWVYLMMEKYCTSTDKGGKTNHFVSRDDLISGYSDANDYWEDMVRKRVAPVRKFYDSEIETSAEYLTKPDQEQLEIEMEKGLVKTSRKRFQRGI